MPNKKKSIFLTFDDGPTPQVTKFVLGTLEKYDAKATFFCIGEKIEKSLSLALRIISQGHSMGNHTYTHFDGWKVDKQTYLADIEKCEKLLRTLDRNATKVFRPPYGRLRQGQYKSLRSQYSPVLWSLMSGDFDPNLTKESCLSKTKNLTRPGDIIVFHDNDKSFKTLKFVLPRYLEYCSSQGYQFELIKS